MVSEEQWTRTAEERAELVAKAQAWQGSQRAFADAHGIAQGTVSRWLSVALRTTRTAEEWAELAAQARAWNGTQHEFAETHGIDQSTVSRWLSGERMPSGPPKANRRPGGQSLVLRPTPLPTTTRVPTMLEVVPIHAPPPPVAAVPPDPVCVRLALPGGAELRFDSLPPARWVAELAAALARC